MKNILLLSVSFFLLFAVKAQTPSANNILYVNTNVGGGTGSGDSWANAIPELADALKYARTQDLFGNGWDGVTDSLQIFVAVGTYKPLYDAADANYTTNGNRDNAFVMVKNVQLYGGFDPTNGIDDLADNRIFPTSSGTGTILSGDLNGDDGPLFYNNQENAFHVLISSDNVGTALLDGFTITRGAANGITTSYVNGNPFLQNQGGGVYNYNSSPAFSHVILTINFAYSAGGGICNALSSPVLTNVSIINNKTFNLGGGIYNASSSPVLTNVSITDNNATSKGGGVMNDGNSTITLSNSIIWGNMAGSGNEIYTYYGDVNLDHCLYGNAAGDIVADNGGTFMFTNSTTDVPLFADPANGNYTLLPDSPAIDAGSSTLYTAAGGDLANDLDLAGRPRVYDFANGGIIDMGAYEYQAVPLVPSAANIIYVNAAVTGGNDSGGSWTNAVPELSDALLYARLQENAGSGWTIADPLKIFVAVGTYKPLYDAAADSYTINGNRDNAFVMVKNVQLYGGFDPANGIDDFGDARIPPSFGGAGGGLGTTLSGDIGVANDNTDNSYHVIISADDVGTALLDGFAITGGNANVTGGILVNTINIRSDYGGGIFNTSSSPNITNVDITNNNAYAGGGGIYNFNLSAPELFDVSITNNTAAIGGGMNNTDSSPELTNVVIRGNTSSSGGGVQNNDSSPMLTNVIIANNTATNYAGGMYNSNSSSPILTNVTIANNTADHAGGIYNSVSSIPILKNSILWGNTADFGNEIESDGSSGIILDYCLYGNDTGDIYGQGTITATNSLTDDPLFTDPANGDYTLQVNSPAINEGSNDLYLAAGGNLQFGLDVAGNPRVYNYTYQYANWGFVDMGAYEYQGAEITFVYQDDTAGWLSPMGNPNGISTFHDDVLVQSGTAIFSEDIKMNNLTIETDANVNVQQALMMWKNIINNGSMLFVSNSTMLGQLGYMGRSTISGTGEITVERHIPARDDGNGAWRFLTSSMNSTGSIHANWQEGAAGINDDPNPGYGMFITGSKNGSSGFDATDAGEPSMFSYDNLNNPEQAFTAVTNTNVDSLVAGHPYAVYIWGDRGVDISTSNVPLATSTTLRVTGNFVTGDQTFTLSEEGGAFSLIGNPFQAIVDMNFVTIASDNVNIFTYYVWDPNLGTRGAYATVELPMGNPTPSGSDTNQYLMPGQAAWVLTESDGPASIKFEGIAKSVSVDPTDVFRGEENDMTIIELQLFQAERYAKGQTLSDAVKIKFSENGNNSVQPNDAKKLPNMDENLARTNANKHLSIENRALPVDGETLPLFTNQYRTSNYVFSAIVENLPAGTKAILLDNYLNIQTEFANNHSTVLSFNVDPTVLASIAKDRFAIQFAVDQLSVESNLIKELSMYPNPVGNGVFFINAPGLSGEKVQVSMFDILGRKVYENSQSIRSNERADVPVHSLQTGIYMVEMTHNGETLTGKIVVE